MKTFKSFVRKEFIHIIRDWRTTLIVLVLPMVLVLIFGYAISTEINEIKLAAVVEKPNEEIRRQLAAFDANPVFDFKGAVAPSQIDDLLRKGDAQAVIIYKADGDVQLVADASDANISAASSAYLQQALSGTEGQTNLLVTMLRFNPQMKSAYMYVPGIMGLIFILICAIMTSVSIVREKETGTMEVLLVSPMKPFVIIVAKLIPYFVVSCINLATILLLVHFAMGVPLISLGGIIVLSLVYVILSLSIGLLISTVTQKQIVALLASAMLMMLPMMMFSGMIFPVENLPKVLAPIHYIIPAFWYNDAMRKLMVEGVSFAVVIKQFVVLCGMAAAVIAISLLKFNDRLES